MAAISTKDVADMVRNACGEGIASLEVYDSEHPDFDEMTDEEVSIKTKSGRDLALQIGDGYFCVNEYGNDPAFWMRNLKSTSSLRAAVRRLADEVKK